MADFMGKSELFDHPLSGWLYRRLGGFAIRRGRQARDGLNEAVRRLQAGRVVVIFPEGGRNSDGRLGRPLPGLGLIVAQTGLPVVPVYVAGAAAALPVGSWLLRPHPVTVGLGRPIDFSGSISHSEREDYQAISDTVMARIAELEAELRRRRPESFAAPLRQGAER
jgi:1-acyl-sn-glycerol-3-phosphate acyltransferase